MTDAIHHCIIKIEALVAEGLGDRRPVFQLGYNLGRLSELTGLGREPFWDRWKEAVDAWDVDTLRILASGLHQLGAHSQIIAGDDGPAPRDVT